MGIYDRDYYRRERSGIFSIFEGTGQVCTTLIAVTVIAFVIQVATRSSLNGLFFLPNSGPFTESLDFESGAILHHGQIWRLITYAFLHSTESIWHIVFNMLIFWMVGREVESIYGPREFLAYYLIAALCGGLAQLLAGWAMPQLGGRMLGASGAVTAVLVLFAMHFPTRIFYFMLVIPMPVIALVVLNVAIDVMGLVGGARGGVAVACHLGGALFGFLYYKLDWRILRYWPSMPDWKKVTRRQPRLKVYRGEAREEPVGVHAGSRSAADSELEAELDTVLEKVSRFGKSSLTEREQQVLLRASEIYRNKRK
jgi:rhomboid family protein